MEHFIEQAKCIMNKGFFNLRGFESNVDCKNVDKYPGDTSVWGIIWNLDNDVLKCCADLEPLICENLWKLKISWDHELPPNCKKEFLAWFKDTSVLKNVNIPRHLKVNISSELHVFVGVAGRAYAACVFVRSIIDSKWEGPAWLKENPENWRTGEIIDQPSEIEVERRKIKIVNIDLANDAPLLWHLHNIANYSKMIKVLGCGF
ncbi:DUF1758 domain-containing protein [Trichonephila clavipes]|nr:DUF1758 domain-containing protein [Trichonephila clavipes]